VGSAGSAPWSSHFDGLHLVSVAIRQENPISNFRSIKKNRLRSSSIGGQYSLQEGLELAPLLFRFYRWRQTALRCSRCARIEVAIWPALKINRYSNRMTRRFARGDNIEA
jgi:hypothetical protein